MRKTLLQALLSAFCAILAHGSFCMEGGGVMLAGRCAMFGEPYTRLEWIQSNGSNTSSGTECSYIDTGIEPKYGMTARLEWQWVRQPTGSSGYGIIFGGGKFDTSSNLWQTWGVGTEKNGRKVYNGIGFGRGGEFSTTTENGWYISNGRCGNYNYESSPKDSWFLFAQNESWATRNYSFNLTHFAILKLRHCRIMMYDDIVHDYIPAKRNSDLEVGLLDVATGAFVKSSSGIEFSAGPIIA